METAAIGAVRDGGLAPMEVAEVETLRLCPSLLSVSVDAHQPKEVAEVETRRLPPSLVSVSVDAHR